VRDVSTSNQGKTVSSWWRVLASSARFLRVSSLRGAFAATFLCGFTNSLQFDACTAYVRCPPAHHKYIRTTNLAERSIEEERRRTKTIPRFFDEESGLKLCYAALIRASERWQRITISDFDRTRMAALRDQLHHEHLMRRGKATAGPKSAAKTGGVAVA